MTLLYYLYCAHSDLAGCALLQGRLTLLLGPPGAGKSTFLKALGGKLRKDGSLQASTLACQPGLLETLGPAAWPLSLLQTLSRVLGQQRGRMRHKCLLLQQSGEILYNGEQLHSFIPERTAVYVDQNDLSIPDMSVREVSSNSEICKLGRNRACHRPRLVLIQGSFCKPDCDLNNLKVYWQDLASGGSCAVGVQTFDFSARMQGAGHVKAGVPCAPLVGVLVASNSRHCRIAACAACATDMPTTLSTCEYPALCSTPLQNTRTQPQLALLIMQCPSVALSTQLKELQCPQAAIVWHCLQLPFMLQACLALIVLMPSPSAIW